MGQTEVLTFLKDEFPNYFSTKEISENANLNFSTASIRRNLKALKKSNSVEIKIVTEKDHNNFPLPCYKATTKEWT